MQAFLKLRPVYYKTVQEQICRLYDLSKRR